MITIALGVILGLILFPIALALIGAILYPFAILGMFIYIGISSFAAGFQGKSL